MKWIKSAPLWFWNNLQTLALVLGWAGSFGISAWAAAATEWLGAYGRIAWVACGFLGALLFTAVIALVAFTRNQLIWGTIRKQFYEKTDRIDPMDSHFLRKRIRLEDLLGPDNFAVEGKTFEDCDIIGPLNIYILDCAMQRNIFVTVDHIIVSEDAAREGRIRNARVFRNCRFLRCRIFNVSLLFVESSYQDANYWRACNWITYTPDNPAPPANVQSDQVPATAPNAPPDVVSETQP